MPTKYDRSVPDDAAPFTKIDHGVDRKETEATAEVNKEIKENSKYATFMDLINDTPEDKEIYLGAEEGSGWIFIAKPSNMKKYMKRVNRVCSKKYKTDVKKTEDGPWIDFEKRKVLDFYPRISPGDNGICVIVEGRFPGRSWTVDEQANNYRKDREREEKIKAEKEKAEAKRQQELEWEQRKKHVEEEEKEAQKRYDKEHEKYYSIMDCY